LPLLAARLLPNHGGDYMNGLQAYGIILAVVLTDPATIGAAARLWMRFRGIRRAVTPPRRGPHRALFEGITPSCDLRQKRIGSNSVHNGGKGANQ